MEAVLQYFRCPERYLSFEVGSVRSGMTEYCPLGSDVWRGDVSNGPNDFIYDAFTGTSVEQNTSQTLFSPTEAVDNLRLERYVANGASAGFQRLMEAYYTVRPVLPVALRKHLQRIYLRGWRSLSFPNWPVDRTVDNLCATLLLLSLRFHRVERIPFIWFWPEGTSSCIMMTHDIETASGRDFCPTLMNIDDSYGIKSSFQIVPEGRYTVSAALLHEIRRRGFEINIQDLNHDGRLFSTREGFLARVDVINSYARQFEVSGFRSAVLYRRQDWYDALNFSYDMSVPNVAHLDPQHGGCCTVMPYFVGKILELPVTTTQDYSLFHILNDYSLSLWSQQVRLIMEKNGLISFIVHPDYIRDTRPRRAYEALLSLITELRSDNVWIATPGEVNTWWRQRSQMRLIEEGSNYRIDGPGSERARVAFAYEQDAQLKFTLGRNPATSHEKAVKPANSRHHSGPVRHTSLDWSESW
jgi:hypothetical protein